MTKRKRPAEPVQPAHHEPTPWPQYLAEKEQEVLALRKLVREAAEMLEVVEQCGENAYISVHEVGEWMARKRQVLGEKRDDEEEKTGEGEG